MKSRTRIKDKVITKIITISFVSVFLTFIFLGILVYLAFKFGDWELIIPPNFRPGSPVLTLLILSLISLIFGLIASSFISVKFLQPVNELKRMTTRVARGDFTVQIKRIPDNEFGEFIQDFNTMVKELRKNELLKSDFVSNVSHEFKTPLSIIEGYATLLQNPALSNEEKEKYTQIIIDSTRKLNTLVNNVLKISKIDNRKITLSKEKYFLDEQIRESILFYQDEWMSKNIEFEINLEICMINADKNLLLNVWNNLINNAIKFSKENSIIYIDLIKEEKNVKVKIKDNGIGISKEDIPYIFDKFFQSDKSHKSLGNGLGLTLVKDIVDLSKGKIEVISELNKGSEFIVTLPLN